MHFKTLCCFWQTLAGQTDEPQRENTIRTWFANFSSGDQDNRSDLLALSSCLLPHRRPDRVYGVREKSLADIAVRGWAIGPIRGQRLRDWQSSHDALDFATTMRALVEEGGELAHVRVPPTVDEVDNALSHLASACPFSSPGIRDAFQYEQHSCRQELMIILQRMTGLEAEWMCRLVLGNLGDAHVPEELVINLLHPALWAAVQVHDALPDAVALIMNSPPDNQSSDSRCEQASGWRPRLGTAIRRPSLEKARSIRHCCQLLDRQMVRVERKYDGEYCQIHVRVRATGLPEVKIFSKSGRDSTADRRALIQQFTDVSILGARTASSGRSACWSANWWFGSRTRGYHAVLQDPSVCAASRSSSWLYARLIISPRGASDDHLSRLFTLRRHRLHSRGICATTTAPGRSRGSPARSCRGGRVHADMSKASAPLRVTQRLAHATAHQWEGLVLKPCQAPYLSLEGHQHHQVKMRKDMIPGLGDAADLVVMGGKHNMKSRTSEWWTTFYLACVDSTEGDEDHKTLPS